MLLWWMYALLILSLILSWVLFSRRLLQYRSLALGNAKGVEDHLPILLAFRLVSTALSPMLTVLELALL